MKRIHTTLLGLSMAATMFAQGWPSSYDGVMLQGFSWDSYDATKWTTLESQADELASYFNLIWLPQSGKCLESYNTMGYMPYYYFNHNSSFGTEAELRSLLKTFKAKGLGAVADVVVNHHNTSGWFGFPAETYNGVTYQLQSTDICANDDGGATQKQATKDGVSLSSNNDEGEDWSGCRDLDHKSANVQKVIKAYVKFLKDDLGYTGFRYDMVKGFNGSHVGDYNDAAGIEYSVGECWDSNATIENWINATSKKSAAFDFQFRYNMRDAVNNGNWAALNSTNNLIHDTNYRRYAVTFVENHDTQYRSATEQNDPIKKDTLALNAFMLAMPGTPCVFQPHWLAYKQDIKGMIDVRRAVGITNESTYTGYYTNSAKYYANTVTGSKGKLIVLVGEQTPTFNSSQWTKAVSGYHYSYWLSNDMNTAWADKASGTYVNSVDVTLSAVTSTSGAKLVYTTDGSTPTASSKSVASGTAISLTSSCTLTVGLLINGAVTGTVKRTYTIEKFDPYTISVYVNVEKPGWSKVNYWAWDSNGENLTATGKWPGDNVTTTETVGGKTWYRKDYTISTYGTTISFVFSTGTGSPQTVDVTGVGQTSYFEVTDEATSTEAKKNYKVNDVTATVTGIDNAVVDVTPTDNNWYSLNGVRLSTQPTQKGIYIHQGRKVVVR